MNKKDQKNWFVRHWVVSSFLGLFLLFIVGIFSGGDSSQNNADLTGNVIDNSEIEFCIPNWQCDEWSECSTLGIQNRICTDSNNCGKTSGKPTTYQPCILTKSQIVSQSINTPEYDEIFRHSENYEGSYIHIKGEVIQVLYDSNNRPSDLRINTGFCDYGEYFEGEYCEDTYYLTFENYGGERILEEDIVDIYGKYDGLYSYESIWGETITIPRINGLYVDIFN